LSDFASTGQSCIRFKRLSDVDETVLADLFLQASGLGSAGGVRAAVWQHPLRPGTGRRKRV
jgi:hypothetical protein